MDYLIENYKNPLDIYKYSNKNSYLNDILNDPNSYLWHELIKQHYRKYIKFKNKYTNLKDFYVLIHHCDILNLLGLNFILFRCQKLLNLLPKIYDGDHLAVINACTNISIISNSANIILYRDKFSKKVFGSGFLTYQYKDVKQDLFVNSNNLSNYKNSKYSNNLYGYVYH